MTSLQETRSYFTGFLPTKITLSNYIRAFTTTNLKLWLLNTTLYCTITIITNIIFGFLAGYALSRLKFKGRDMINFLIVGTMFVPGFLLLIPQYLIVAPLGLTNNILGLCLPYLVDAFNIFLIRQYMLTIPIDLDDAARIDGCSDLQILTRIIAPLCKPVLTLVIVLTFLVRWNDFLWPLIVMTQNNNYVLTVGLSSLHTVRGADDVGLTMAVTLLSLTGPLVLFIFFQKYLVEGMVLTGIKA
jgi:ABC-type glycerol-3-phosphate transport system permease component